MKCQECDGCGEVEWEYAGHTKDSSCPICDGDGRTSISTQVKNGKTTIEDHLYIKIGVSTFSAKYIMMLVDTSVKLKEDTITLTHQDKPVGVNTFNIGELYILLCPVLASTDYKIIFTITL